jgi:hypothetical protein
MYGYPLRAAFETLRTWLSNQHWVVLGAPAQDLNAAPDLIVTTNHRI